MLKKIIIILILLIMLVATSALADDDNLIQNGDFEGGESEDLLPSEWFSELWYALDEYTEISVTDIDGNQALKITNKSENDARIAQNIKVKGNKTYKLSGYIFAYDVKDGQGANLSVENVMSTTEGVFDSNGQWQYVELYGKTALFQNYLKIFIRVGGYGALSSGEAYFDDITLEEVKKAPAGVEVVSFKKPKDPKPDKEGVKFLAPSIIITLIMVLLFLIAKNKLFSDELEDKPDDMKLLFWLILFAGLVIRLSLSMTVRGYPNDISCWLGWSNACANNGLFNIYETVDFLDYPPGYMYILNILGIFMKILNGVFGEIAENVQWLIVKIPSILADIALSVIIYKVASKKIGSIKALILMAIYFLSPVVILISSAWGQIDGILALFAVLYLLALYKRKFWLAGILLAIGVLMKIQMVLFSPLYLTAAWSAGWEYFKEKKGWQFVKDVGLGILTGSATLFIFGMYPFFIYGGVNNPVGFIDLYKDSVDTYNYLSINATNFWTIIGGNWYQMERIKGIIDPDNLTIISVAIPIVIFLIFGFIDRKKEHIFMHAALLITGIFMISVKMHERYMFPALALIIMSIVFTKRRSSFILFILFSVTQFLNTAIVLANQHLTTVYSWSDVLTGNERLQDGKLLVLLISSLAVAGYAYMIYVAIKMYKNSEENPIFNLTSSKNIPKAQSKSLKKYTIESEEGFFKKLTKWDALLMGGLTLVYAIVAFINLGSLIGPETNFKTVTAGSEIIVDFGEEKDISELWFFRGKASSNSSFFVSYADDIDGEYKASNYIRITYGGMFDDTEDETAEREIIKEAFSIEGDIYEQIFFTNYPDILKWERKPSISRSRFAKVTFEKSGMYIFELGFKDAKGNVIPIERIKYDEANEKMPLNYLFDEQDTIPEEITYMNGTYFDEIYHAGTAWEHLNFVDPYETTHPPLGKVIMSWGIKMFGTNTFGWRFMGTLVGVLMVPVMYLLALLILKKTRYAFIAAFLFTFDFMHFTQTRIATIDSYGVFFIMLMYLFMGIYYYMSYNKSKLIKTLIPLGLSGIAFGLGSASKWICLYAGAGLAVIFFLSLYKRWKEYLYVKNDGTGLSKNYIDKIKDEYKSKTIITLAWCVLFFIIIPILIYVASYIPIMKIGPSFDLRYVLENQKNMLNYHSGLGSTHSFASPWYEWPLIIKPMWYYSNDAVREFGKMGSIAAFGNPAVWWIGTLAILYLFVDTYLQKKPSKAAIFIILAFFSQYLPWVLVPRSMFIYHYFASVPFVVCAIVYAIKTFEERYKMNKKVVYYYLGVVLLLFAFFYPVLTGTVISSSYGKFMKWLPSWWFIY